MIKRLAFFFAITACIACSPVAPKPEQADNDFSLIELTIAQAHAAFSSNKISCENLTRRYLKRIAAYDQPTKLNAIIYANPNAIEKAVALDKKFAAQGSMKKLHCIPVILKDNFDTHDMPTEAGSIALKGSLPPDDAFMVKKLREQDAIIIAKSNMGEWAFSPYNTISSTHGETRNAYDLTRVPAGSSGGTASAIAANFGIIGMGSDTGNSIRGPASHLSLVGIRSTMGSTSRDGIVPLVLNRDIGGPLMRTVTDTAMVYSVIAGFDPDDPITKAVANPNENRIKKDYTVYLKPDGLNSVRLGVIRQLFDTESADPEVLKIMDRAIAELKKSGAIIIDPFKIENFDKLKDATGFCSRFYYDINNYLKTLGRQVSVHSLDDIVEKKLFRPQNIEAIQWALSEKGDPASQNPPCTSVQGDPRRKAFLDAVVTAMDSNKVDAIIYPSWSNPPRKLGDNNSPHGNNSPIIAPHTGQPAITVPMGFTKDGLPVGLQLLARPFDEHKLFQYAFAYEQATNHRKPPTIFGEPGQ